MQRKVQLLRNEIRIPKFNPLFRTIRDTYISYEIGKKSIAYKNNNAPSKKETQGRADRFDAITREFMFTISKLTKKLPDSDRTVLKNINLCFFPGNI